MVEITKYMLNRYYTAHCLRMYISIVGREYTNYMNKKQLVDYIVKNQKNLLFIDLFQRSGPVRSVYDKQLATRYSNLMDVHRQLLHEYHNNYCNMKIVHMFIMSEI
jgi:hypothetical protein